MIMVRSILLLVFVTVCNCALSQDKTILIAESSLPYTSQTWFYSGVGNELNESEIKKNWDEGRRITSLAYTKNGWFVTMAKITGIGMQTYSYSVDWPHKWIDEKWNEGYYITSISCGNGKWCVVMSKGVGYTYQTWIRNTLAEVVKWRVEKLKEGYFVTSMAYDGTYWTMVGSKGAQQYSTQGHLFANTYDDLVSQANKNIWDKSYRIHLLEYGDGKYFVIYGNYSKDNGRGQSFCVDYSDMNDYINKRWSDSQNIAYLGGGYSKTGVQNGNETSNKRCLGKRTGKFYYINDSHQQVTLNFYWNGGNYFADSSTLGMAYGWLPRYVLSHETADEYIFKQAKVYFGGKVEIMEYQPQMIISKGWDRIVLKKANMGQDFVVTKEVTKAEYDKITQSKSNLINSFGGGSEQYQHEHNHDMNNDSRRSYVDGPCKYCGGGGGCSSCNGTGLKYNPYSGEYDTCPSCRGTGRCFNCFGTGKQATY